jgi:hypothetical protein
MPTVSFTGIKSCTASADAVDVVFKTRYSGDLSVTMTRACLGELVEALAGEAPSPSQVPSPPAKALTEERPPANAAADDNVSVRVPKKWAVAAETNLHNLVLLFFDPKTDAQSSFALSPAAATVMARGLVEKAKVVADSVAARKPRTP